MHLIGHLFEETKDKLQPQIPRQGSPMTAGGSPDRVQANYLVVGLTHTLGGLRIRPMPIPACCEKYRCDFFGRYPYR